MPLVHIVDAFLSGLAGLAGANSVSAKWASSAFAGFAHTAAPAAVTALWQGALVALALVLCLRFAFRVSAAHRFAAWAAGFAVAAGLPLLPLLEHSSVVIAAAPSGGATTRPWLELDSRWGFAIAAIWLAASAFRAAELAYNLLRLRRLWRGATPIDAEGNLRALLAAALPARRIEICTTPDLDRPSVIGFFAPRILIPEWLYSRLTPGELEQVVLHEAEHLRRRDDWTNLLQKLSLVVFPLNPALAWMERRLCREREMACDEGVIQRTKAPRTYAACLTTLAERGVQRREFLRRAQALSLGVLGRRPELVDRVDSILRCKRALHPLAAGMLVGVMGCGLVIGALELSRSPQLIAFVAAPAPDAQTRNAQTAVLTPLAATPGVARLSQVRTVEPAPAAADAVFRPSERLRARFRAIDANAIVPASRSAATPVAARSPLGGDSSAGESARAMTNREAAPREMLANAAAPATAAATAQGQEFIVLTAWEEVQTSALGAGTIADYETGPRIPGQRDAKAGQPDATRDAQITFTRLILVVYPVSVEKSTQPARTTSSNSHRPTVSAFDGGWLFFQL